MKRIRVCDPNKRKYYRIYTAVFLAVAAVVFLRFFILGKTLIWNTDGWDQHYKALVYYGRHLRGIGKNLFSTGRLIIPQWDFALGEGNDILATLHYYVIGDPLALTSAFVPAQFTHILFSALAILRVYFSGLAFSALCFGMGKKNNYGILAGALTYSFSYWTLMSAIRHPYFLSPMIYFPLMILGLEKILRRERPYLFIVSTALAAASNFYFLYILAVLGLGYGLLRIIKVFRKVPKTAAAMFGKLILNAAVGLCMAAVILAPVLFVFLGDSRFSGSVRIRPFYPLGYYSAIPGSIISKGTENWLYIGISGIALLAIFLLFRRKGEKRFLKLLFFICLFLMISPFAGHVLNGLSYATNRWTWAFVLLCAYILTDAWDDLVSLSLADWKILLGCAVAYGLLCVFLRGSRTAPVFTSLFLVLLALFVLRPAEEGKGLQEVLQQRALCGLVIAHILILSLFSHSMDGDNWTGHMVDSFQIAKNLRLNEAADIQTISHGKAQRFTGNALTVNANMIEEISSTQYYWSLSNSYLNKWRESLGMPENMPFMYNGYDDRTAAIGLSAVDYYVLKKDENGTVPYGYSKVFETITKEFYQNDYALPLAYCYDQVIDEDTWEEMTPLQRQEAELQAAYVDEGIEGLPAYREEAEEYEIKSSVKYNEQVIAKSEVGYTATEDEAVVELSFDAPAGCEVYIGFDGLDFRATSVYDLYFGDSLADPKDNYSKDRWLEMGLYTRARIKRDHRRFEDPNGVNITVTASNGIEKSMFYRSEYDRFTSCRHDFLINLGYTDEPLTGAEITFAKRGIYTLDKLSVYCVPMDGYAEKVEALAEHSLQHIAVGTDEVRGDIDLDEAKLLCMAIPYAKGWSATVDGKEEQVRLVNERYLGLVLPAGAHEVVFRYQTPFLRTGLLLSCIGVAVFVLIIIFTEQRRRVRGIIT